MDAPISQLPIAIIEKIAPPARMQFWVKRPERSRTAPQIPIHAIRRNRILRSRFLAATTVGGIEWVVL